MRILVTGGCGFIGTNLVFDRLRRGDAVRVLDNCARLGTERNLARLRETSTDALDVIVGDVRDGALVAEAVADVDVVVHLAAQVAVTTSVAEPRADFEVNALGTLNVLESARLSPRPPLVVYASTNKVYGGLEDLEISRAESRYELVDRTGIAEDAQLDFHSPYGCSKGAGDQYVLDYARVYGVPTVVFRQSCIYGPWQYGNEDQGWIAHFAARALRGERVTIFGDGRQVRDVLHVDDLLRLYDTVLRDPDRATGNAYNIGGGAAHTVSVRACLDALGELLGRDVDVVHEDWRPGDQRIYVSDVGKAQRELGWAPAIPFEDGLPRLVDWLRGELQEIDAGGDSLSLTAPAPEAPS